MSVLPEFDPKAVPVVQVDDHLPPVPLEYLQPQAVRERFAREVVWTPENLVEPRFSARQQVHASVLVPLVVRSQLQVLLTQRTAHLSSHSGQIAFPGGKADADDADAVETALREAQEEVGMSRSHIEVLGRLPTYTTGSGYWVTPVVALVQPVMAWEANPFEVSEVFEVPLSFLMTPAHHRHHTLHWADAQRRWLSMPYTDGGQERFIWGATAGMLRNLYRFLAAQ